MQFVETFARELAGAIREAGFQEATVVRSGSVPASELDDLQWYCGRASSETEGQFFVGAAQETWESIGGAPDALLRQCTERALAEHPKAKALVADIASSEAPRQDWSRAALEFGHGTGAPLPLHCVLSPAFEAATETVPEPVRTPSIPTGFLASDLLAQVHVPVSVSFGGTQIRMKELLSLSTGSVVELDQGMSDSVEIRVNNCLIARGEVVAVDGHYGVRVLELMSGVASAAKGLRA